MSFYNLKPSSVVWATDSEWDTNESQSWISTAFCNHDTNIIFIRSDIPEAIKHRLRLHATRRNVDISFVDQHNDDTNLAALAGVGHGDSLLNFYSAKDFEYAVGWNIFKDNILCDKVSQKRNIRGVVGDGIIIKDCFGLANGNQKAFIQSVGLECGDKGLMDKYKSNMMQGLLTEPELYFDYSIADAVMLRKAFFRFVLEYNKVLSSVGIPKKELFTIHTLPMTTGSLVAKSFERWLYQQVGDTNTFKFCLAKQGALDSSRLDYKKVKDNYKSIVDRIRTVDDVKQLDKKAFKQFVRPCNYMIKGLASASIRAYASHAKTSSCRYNAIVQGGRCCNEYP